MNKVIPKASLKKNYVFNTVYQVVTICVPIITAPYLCRVIGADGLGIYSLCFSNVTYFTMFAVLGSGAYGQKRIASCRDDVNQLSRAFWEILLFRTVTVLITILAFAIFYCNIVRYKDIYLILSLNILNVLFDITWFYQGVEDFPRIVMRNLITRIAQVICIFSFIKSSDDLALYVIFTVVFLIFANLWTWISVPRYIRFVKKINIFRDIKEILVLFVPTVAIQVYLVLDKTMIGLITDSPYQNGCYEQSEKIVRMALTVVTSIAAVILPRVANLYNNGNQEKAKEYVYLGFRVVFLLAIPMMTGLFIVSDIFVPVFFGEGFDLAIILIPIFCVLILTVSVSYVTGFAFLIPIGKQNIYTIVVCACAAINLVLNIIMIPYLGAIGAAVSSIVAEMIGALVQVVYCVHTGLLEKKRIFKGILTYSFASAIMIALLSIIKTFIQTSIWGLIILVFSGIIIYFLMLLIQKDSFVLDNLNKFLKKVKE